MKKLIIDEKDLKTILEAYMIWGLEYHSSFLSPPAFSIEELQSLAKAKDFNIEVKEE